MLIISIGSWGARTVMLTYQEMGHVLIPNEPLFTPPPSRPPHRGRSVVFHNWRKAVSLPYPRGERPTGLPPHPCGELTEIRHPQGFFMPPPVPHRGSTPAVRSLLDSSPSFCAAKIYVHGQRIKMYILLYI